ncbi:hypothetical protein QBC35DRAFT_550149, partial [Podospora australis]
HQLALCGPELHSSFGGPLLTDCVCSFEDPACRDDSTYTDEDAYRAKVADFGFAARFQRSPDGSDDVYRLRLPISVPWNAPEQDRLAREFVLQEAKDIDVYSLGLVCLWLLFEPFFSGEQPAQDEDPMTDSGVKQEITVDLDLSATSRPTLDALVDLKISNELQMCACELLSKERSLSPRITSCIQAFLVSSLSRAPLDRQGSLERFLEHLETHIEYSLSDDGQRGPNIDSNTPIKASDYKIEEDPAQLYRCDFRIRPHIAECLIQQHNRTGSLASQVAICYYVGLGVPRDINSARGILVEAGFEMAQVQGAEAALSQTISRDPQEPSEQWTVVKSLDKSGYVSWANYAKTYFAQDLLTVAEQQLLREKADLDVACSSNHVLMVTIRRNLSDVYRAQNKWADSENLDLEVVDIYKKVWGERNAGTLESIAHLGAGYIHRSLYKEAVKTFESLSEIVSRVMPDDHASRMSYITSLALAYQKVGGRLELEEAEKLDREVLEMRTASFGPAHLLTLTNKESLATTMHLQGRYAEAEETLTEVLGTAVKYHGADSEITITAMNNMAALYSEMGRMEEAEELETDVYGTAKAMWGEEDPRVIGFLANLAETCWDLGRSDEAEERQLRALTLSMEVLGEDDSLTKTIKMNLASNYLKQGRRDEAASLLREGFEGLDFSLSGIVDQESQ